MMNADYKVFLFSSFYSFLSLVTIFGTEVAAQFHCAGEGSAISNPMVKRLFWESLSKQEEENTL